MTSHVRLRKAAVERGDLSARLRSLHMAVRSRYPFVARVALALYDTKTDLLKTFANSSEDGEALLHYEAPLQAVPSLRRLRDLHANRVVDDIASEFPQGSAQQLAQGARLSQQLHRAGDAWSGPGRFSVL